MSDRCEPPEELRGVDGWHWVQADADRLHPAKWSVHDEWWDLIHISGSAWEIGQLGYRYVAPVATPAEVKALRARVERLEGVLRDAALQLEYLDGRWPTGTTPPILTRISAALEDRT